MSESTPRPSLFVVPGEGRVSGNRRNPSFLLPLPAPKPTAPQQMGLHGVALRPDTLISLGLRGLTFDVFSSVLSKHGTRVVLDLRVSPSFRGSGFSLERVLALFEAQRIRYRRLTALVHQPDDTLLNEHIRRDRYASFLEAQKDARTELRALIRSGPVVLLGWETEHAGSDRSVLVDALQRDAEPFDLALAP